MALLNLAHVTRTLLSLLEYRLPGYPDWPNGSALIASPAPPDLVSGNYALSFYLYHVKEDAHTKSQDWQADDGRPLRFKPMGLTLNYVLCPRSNVADLADRAYVDQLLMGLCLKTLHDYPCIDDTTTVESGGVPKLVMPAAIRGWGNRLRILMRPAPVEEASQYWQAGSQAARLAAYFEVSAVLLEPDEITRRAARVLSVGVHSFVRGRPIIEGTHNTLQFTPPGDSQPRDLQISPAEVGFGGQFEVYGSDLKGDGTALLINHPGFAAGPVEVDPSWNVNSNGSLLTAVARPAAGAQALLPGIYSVIVRTTARRTLPDGSQRDFDNYSNAAPLSIVPVIANIGFAAGLGTMTVTGFDPSTLSGQDLMLYAGGERLIAVNAAPAAGQFRSLTPDKIEFVLPGGLTPGAYVALRLIVRSAESAPTWVSVP